MNTVAYVRKGQGNPFNFASLKLLTLLLYRFLQFIDIFKSIISKTTWTLAIAVLLSPRCWYAKQMYVVMMMSRKQYMRNWPFGMEIHPSIVMRGFQYFMMTSSNGDIFRVTGHLCGNSTVPAEFPAQRPVTRSFDAFFDLRLNKRLSEQWWGWWFETSSRHYDVIVMFFVVSWNNILLYYKQMDIGVMHTPIFLRVISTILYSYI